MPELSTCSRCGTRFVTQVEVCELCGAPIIPGEAGEPDRAPVSSEKEPAGSVEDLEPEAEGSPEFPEEEDAGPGEVQETEEEIQEPEAAFPKDTQKSIPWRSNRPSHDHPKEIREPDSTSPRDDRKSTRLKPVKAPRDYPKEIREPDTDALLEQFGSEYDENETLESSRTQKTGTDGDVRFFTQGIRYPRVKLPAARTWIIVVCIVAAAIVIAGLFLGLPMLAGYGGNSTHGNQTAANFTPLPSRTGTIPPAQVTTQGPASGSLIPQPTQQVPAGQNFFFQVRKNPMTRKISVIFTGSSGAGGVSSAAVRVTRPDRTVMTGTILPLEGVNELSLDGSGEADRVEIIAMMPDGATYRVYDGLISP
jgi:hypothetical protein